jgi:presqualene diphosphate phosphatase
MSFFFWPPIFAWWFSVCISRLLLYRHHILDVVGGVFLGLFESLIMAVIWLGPEASANLVSWISDDRISGSDAEII